MNGLMETIPQFCATLANAVSFAARPMQINRIDRIELGAKAVQKTGFQNRGTIPALRALRTS